MFYLFLLTIVASITLRCYSLSLYNPQRNNVDYSALSQKSAIRQTLLGSSGTANNMMTTRRDTIRMPSQTPMVPYMVRLFYFYLYPSPVQLVNPNEKLAYLLSILSSLSLSLIKPPGADVAQFIDIEAAMYQDRTMMISRFIDDEAANSIISILLYLRKESSRDPISIYFNVPGGWLRPSLAGNDD